MDSNLQSKLLPQPVGTKILHPDVHICENTRWEIDEEGQTIVHIDYHCTVKGDRIRIWKNTYLESQECGHRAPLLHAENISFHPVWTHIPLGAWHRFTLIFGGLPSACKHFDLVEDIPEPGGFVITNIARNAMDVYVLEL